MSAFTHSRPFWEHTNSAPESVCSSRLATLISRRTEPRSIAMTSPFLARVTAPSVVLKEPSPTRAVRSTFARSKLAYRLSLV